MYVQVTFYCACLSRYFKLFFRLKLEFWESSTLKLNELLSHTESIVYLSDLT